MTKSISDKTRNKDALFSYYRNFGKLDHQQIGKIICCTEDDCFEIEARLRANGSVFPPILTKEESQRIAAENLDRMLATPPEEEVPDAE